MKNTTEWLKERCGVITVQDLIALQDDARKDGLMTAQLIASDVINAESPKYAQPGQQTPAEMTLSGLGYKVTSAIVTEADKLDYLPGRKRAEKPTSDLMCELIAYVRANVTGEIAAYGNCDCQTGESPCVYCASVHFNERVDDWLKSTPQPEPTQDAATAIAYNAYPSSARPVI